MEGRQRFILTIEFIELNLPYGCSYLRFFIRDLAVPLKYVQEITLGQPARKFPLNESITFQPSSPVSAYSNFENLVGVCVVAVGDDYVAYVGTAIINLKEAPRAEQSHRQFLTMCEGQKGYMIYRLEQEGQKNQKSYFENRVYNEVVRQEKGASSEISKDKLQSFREIPNCKSFQFKDCNSCDCSKQVDQLNYIIDQYKSKVIELVKENSALKESCHIHLEESTNTRDQELAILNEKLLQKYEKVLNQNVELKMRYEVQLGDMKTTIQRLQSVIQNQMSSKQEDVCKLDNFLLKEKLKSQQYVNQLLQTQLQQLRLELQDIQSSLRHEQYARHFNQTPIKKSFSDSLDYQRQINVLLRINDYLKTSQLKQSLQEYFEKHNIDVTNYRQSLEEFLRNLKVDVRIDGD